MQYVAYYQLLFCSYHDSYSYSISYSISYSYWILAAVCRSLPQFAAICRKLPQVAANRFFVPFYKNLLRICLFHAILLLNSLEGRESAMMTVGERIRYRRQELHMTLDEVSAKSGVPKSTIHRWETGAIKNMGQSGLRKVAKALDTSAEFLMTGVSVTITHLPKIEIFPTDVYEYLLKKCGYSYSTHAASVRYYQKGERFIAADEKTFSLLLDQFLPYFSFLIQNQSISIDELLSLIGE